jgi:hypothetical protein
MDIFYRSVVDPSSSHHFHQHAYAFIRSYFEHPIFTENECIFQEMLVSLRSVYLAKSNCDGCKCAWLGSIFHTNFGAWLNVHVFERWNPSLLPTVVPGARQTRTSRGQIAAHAGSRGNEKSAWTHHKTLDFPSDSNAAFLAGLVGLALCVLVCWRPVYHSIHPNIC